VLLGGVRVDKDRVMYSHVCSQPVEEESMVYADLTFVAPRASQPIVIHQEDDSVEYTTIDFTKKTPR